MNNIVRTRKGIFYGLLHPRLTVLIITLCPGNIINTMPSAGIYLISKEPPAIDEGYE
ncbi:hypothetical protein [Vulcanisaeta sp. JCM 16159]|uniref:hypothetical protein n=1 Tax=Vulcanisaeta sp. JCM 16159 TaxID=1295371 RepID=UPI000B084D31|nr:hypothetical protein [Vulcanisaeta sp. JCM 16159]